MKIFLQKLAGVLGTLMLVFGILSWLTALPTIGLLWSLGVLK
jgi:hypothetical protein